MNNAFNNGVISTTASDAAGIMAYTGDVTTLSFCANYGNVSAKAEAAGIVANATKNLELTSSFNAGDITVTTRPQAASSPWQTNPKSAAASILAP